jgi:hypothetical protein
MRRSFSLLLVCGSLGLFGAASGAPRDRSPAVSLFLLEESDLPGAAAKTTQSKQQDLSAMRAKVLRGFTLPADLSFQPDRERPIQWVDPAKEPARFLKVGEPIRLKRRPTRLVFPLFSLPELVYFKGTSEIVSQLNAATDYWAQGQHNKAMALLDKLVKEKEKNPAGDHERMVLFLVRGSFNLALYMGKTFGSPQSDANAAVLKGRARADLIAGILTPSLYAFLTGVDSSLDRDLYQGKGLHPVHLEAGHPMPLRPAVLKSPGRSVEPLVWIRSLAPWSLLNIVSLSAEKGYFSQAFLAAERLDDLWREASPLYRSAEVPAPPSFRGVLTSSNNPSVGKPRFLRPHGIDDVISVTRLMRAAALFRQPVESLVHADVAARSASTPALSALAFELIGNVYFDSQNDQWARRVYAWSELMDPVLLEDFPDALLFGAESALWRGLLARSEGAFRGLRERLSDREYGADVELRLLQLALLSGQDAEARTRLEYLRTHYARPEASHVAADVVTLDFCHSAPNLTERARRVDYELTKKTLAKARHSLREHAAACLLFADLLAAQEESLQRKPSEDLQAQRSQVGRDATRQLGLLKAFDQEFPESPFRVLFDAAERHLSLGQAFTLLAQRDCEKSLAFFTEHHGALLAKRASGQSALVAGLSWGQTENEMVTRCAALLNRPEVFEVLRKSKSLLPHPLRDAFLAAKTSKSVLGLRDALVADHGWPLFDGSRLALDRWTTADLESESFWAVFGSHEVLAAEPADPNETFFDRPFDASLSSNEAKVPVGGRATEIALQSQVCSWAQKALRAKGPPLQKRLERFARSLWLAEVSAKGGLTLGDPKKCQTRLTAVVLAHVSAVPSAWGDQHILRPFIEAMGPLPRADLSLAWALRTFERTGEVDEPVLEVMSLLAEKATDALVRQSARSWIKEHALRQKEDVW